MKLPLSQNLRERKSVVVVVVVGGGALDKATGDGLSDIAWRTDNLHIQLPVSEKELLLRLTANTAIPKQT